MLNSKAMRLVKNVIKNKRTRTGAFFVVTMLVNDKGLDLLQKRVRVVRVNGQLDGGEQVKAKDTHDRLAVNHVATRGKVDLAVKCRNGVDKVTNVGNGGKLNVYGFHIVLLLSHSISTLIIQRTPRFVNRFLRFVGKNGNPLDKTEHMFYNGEKGGYMKGRIRKEKEWDAAASFLRYARYGFARREGEGFAMYDSIRGSVSGEGEAAAMLAVCDTLRLLRFLGREETVAAVRAVYFVRHGRTPKRNEISLRVRRFAAEHYLDDRTVYRRLADAKRLFSQLLAAHTEEG